MNMDQWTLVINNVSNLVMAGVMFCQLLILGASFFYASQYLQQFKQQTILQRKIVLLDETANLTSHLLNSFAKSSEFSTKDISKIRENSNSNIKDCGELMNKRLKRRKKAKPEINRIKDLISNNIILLNDKTLNKLWIDLRKSFDDVDYRYENFSRSFGFLGERNDGGFPRSEYICWVHFNQLPNKLYFHSNTLCQRYKLTTERFNDRLSEIQKSL